MYQVVIIEDDPMVASINRQYVELTPSFSVKNVFKSGLDALEFLREEGADLIILDYYTPLMNGAEFIDRLHSMGLAPSVIMVTSANDSDIVRQLLSRGVLDYLVKPFEYERFKAALERFAKLQERLGKARNTMGQNEIDRLLSPQKPMESGGSQLSKGLNEATLNRIRDFLKENRDAVYSSEQLSERIRLSRITVRRYMNYMVETGELISTIDYQTGGRPSIKYRYAKK